MAATFQIHSVADNITVEELAEEEISIEDLKLRISRDQRLLKHLQEQQINTTTEPTKKPLNDEYNRKKKLNRSQEVILKQMLKMMRECDIEGFVYGIVPSSGKPMTGASDNLREWWQEKVKFDKKGPAAIAKYALAWPSNNSNRSNKVSVGSLMDIQDSTLGSILSALMPHCNPPQRKYPLEQRLSPPWWPKGDEEYWAELEMPQGLQHMPYRKPHDLKKVIKAGVVAAVLKHMAPNTDLIWALIKSSRGLQDKILAKEVHILASLVKKEEEIFLETNRDICYSIGPSREIMLKDMIEISSSSSSSGDNCINYDKSSNKEVDSRDNVKGKAIVAVAAENRETVDDQRCSNNILKIGIHVCENKGCIHSNYHFGFLDRAGRDHHMAFECRHKNVQSRPQLKLSSMEVFELVRKEEERSRFGVGTSRDVYELQKIQNLMNSYSYKDSVVNPAGISYLNQEMGSDHNNNNNIHGSLQPDIVQIKQNILMQGQGIQMEDIALVDVRESLPPEDFLSSMEYLNTTPPIEYDQPQLENMVQLDDYNQQQRFQDVGYNSEFSLQQNQPPPSNAFSVNSINPFESGINQNPHVNGCFSGEPMNVRQDIQPQNMISMENLMHIDDVHGYQWGYGSCEGLECMLPK